MHSALAFKDVELGDKVYFGSTYVGYVIEKQDNSDRKTNCKYCVRIRTEINTTPVVGFSDNIDSWHIIN